MDFPDTPKVHIFLSRFVVREPFNDILRSITYLVGVILDARKSKQKLNAALI